MGIYDDLKHSGNVPAQVGADVPDMLEFYATFLNVSPFTFSWNSGDPDSGNWVSNMTWGDVRPQPDFYDVTNLWIFGTAPTGSGLPDAPTGGYWSYHDYVPTIQNRLEREFFPLFYPDAQGDIVTIIDQLIAIEGLSESLVALLDGELSDDVLTLLGKANLGAIQTYLGFDAEKLAGIEAEAQKRKAIVHTTLYEGAFEFCETVNVSSGNAVIHLTDDATSGGDAIFPNTVLLDSVKIGAWGTTIPHHFGTPVLSNSNKTLTIPVTKNNTAVVSGAGTVLLNTTGAADGSTVNICVTGN